MTFTTYMTAIEKLLEIVSGCVSEDRCEDCQAIRVALEVIQNQGQAISQIRSVVDREDATNKAIEEIRAILKTEGGWL